ncbi:MAG: class I SAM-dependent methyltransferase [Acidimicrobiia bacterium]
MKFTIAADSYDRFMGRYSTPLASAFSDFAAITPGMSVLDVGSGTGALISELVKRVGDEAVSAAEPSERFVAAIRERYPKIDVRTAAAEDLSFAADVFDASLAQLVVHFMADPAAGISEMRRVTRAGGTVAACVWDHAAGRGPLSLFWEAARELDPDLVGEELLTGSTEGDLGSLFRAAGLNEVEEGSLTVRVEHPSFEEWWVPFTLGVGPAGSYTAGLDPKRRDELRERCRSMQPRAPFVVTGKAWAARGFV